MIQLERENSRSKLLAKLILMAGVFFCSLSSAFVKYMTAPSSVAATYRLGLTVVLLTGIVPASQESRRELFSLRLKDIALCGLAGMFLAFHFYTWFESLDHTSVSSSTVLVNTEVVFAAFGYILLFGKRIGKKAVAAIAISFAGSVMIAAADNSGGSSALFGDLLALAAAAFSAIYTLIGTRERSHISTGVYTYVVYWGCFLTLLVIDWLTGTPLLGYGMVNGVMALCLAVFCTLLGHSVFSWCLKFLAPTYVSTVKLASPVFASVYSIFLFDEIPGLLQIAGAVVVLCGVYLYARQE